MYKTEFHSQRTWESKVPILYVGVIDVAVQWVWYDFMIFLKQLGKVENFKIVVELIYSKCKMLYVKVLN